jgi:hypothetical protein
VTANLNMPPIAFEAEAAAAVTPTLGRGGVVESRVTVGISHVTDVEADEIVGLPLAARTLLRLSMRVSFRPARDEYFDQVLFSVLLRAREPSMQPGPVAFALAPSRLTSGPYTLRSGLTLGVHARAPGVELKADSEETLEKEVRQPYVVAAGEGESDPEWRYQRTETMTLEGSHEMCMLVDVEPGVGAEAFLSLAGSVVSGRQRVDVGWEIEDRIARIPLRTGD